MGGVYHSRMLRLFCVGQSYALRNDYEGGATGGVAAERRVLARIRRGGELDGACLWSS